MRIVILAGVPESLYDFFYPRIVPDIKERHRDTEVLWSPLGIDVQGYRYDQLYIETLKNKLYTNIKSIVGTTNIHDRKEISVLLLYVEHDAQSTNLLLQQFIPLVLSAACPIGDIYSAENGPNSQKAMLANSLFNSMLKHLKNAQKIQAALARELTSNESRTPFLLPLKNFSNSALRNHIIQSSRLENYDPREPDISVQSRRNEIVRSSVFKRLSDSKKRCFHDDRGVAFKSPGSDRHGIVWLRELNELEPHNSNCVVGARIRLGAAFCPQFHYDCVAAKRKLPRDWTGCHSQPEKLADARTHANVAPNDSVR